MGWRRIRIVCLILSVLCIAAGCTVGWIAYQLYPPAVPGAQMNRYWTIAVLWLCAAGFSTFAWVARGFEKG